MSRTGKSPVVVPDGIDVQLNGKDFKAKGKMGELSMTFVNDVVVTLDGKVITVEPKNSTLQARKMWGTTRALINNIIVGVGEGFTKNLEIVGVGYRAAIQGKNIQLQLGFSHDVLYPIPDGITVKCAKPTSISITGADKQRVGQIASEIRAYRPPEPYKGKGVRYQGEHILRKEGKKK